MAEPVDAIRAIHNAFRKDMERIDIAAFNAAKGKEGLDTTIERFRSLTKSWSGMPMEKRRRSFPPLRMLHRWSLKRM